MELKQDGQVAAYRAQFELISAPLDDVFDGLLMGFFITGLKEEIKNEVWAERPNNLEQAFALAQRVEERNWAYNRADFRIGRNQPSNFTKPSPNSVTPTMREDSTRTTERSLPFTQRKEDLGAARVVKKEGFRRLTDAEYKSKMEKGECSRCDEKFGLGHRCRAKQLQVLLVTNEEEETEDSGEEEAGEEVEVEEKLLELSINSFSSESTPKTMKLRGTLKGRDILILLDCGATHNFLAKQLVDELHLPISGSNRFIVTVGDGRRIKGVGLCEECTI